MKQYTAINDYVANRTPENREKCILENMPLLSDIAWHYAKKYKQPHDEMMSLGAEGLIHAVENFDPTNGAKFVTYAWWCISGRIRTWAKRQMFRRRICPIVTELSSISRGKNHNRREFTPSSLGDPKSSHFDSIATNEVYQLALSATPPKHRELIRSVAEGGMTRAAAARKCGFTRAWASQVLIRFANKMNEISGDDYKWN